jgi:hypothetical protein
LHVTAGGDVLSHLDSPAKGGAGTLAALLTLVQY